MTLSINDNASLFSIGKLTGSQNNLRTASERLASGNRINRAQDDAAGLAIATRLASQLLGSQTAYRNTNDGISLLQTAEGGVSELSNISQRVRELSIQAGNGTLSDQDRTSIQAEVSQLQEEASRIIDSTEFNGTKLLAQNNSIELQVGSQSREQISINTTDLKTQLTTNGFFSVDVSTANGAQTALSSLDATIDTLTKTQSNFGALSNRLETTNRNTENRAVNIAAAKSRIQDADFAAEIANQTSALIQQQAGLATASHANLSGNLVSQLLK